MSKLVRNLTSIDFERKFLVICLKISIIAKRNANNNSLDNNKVLVNCVWDFCWHYSNLYSKDQGILKLVFVVYYRALQYTNWGFAPQLHLDIFSNQPYKA